VAEATISIEAAMVVAEGAQKSGLDAVTVLLREALELLEQAERAQQACMVIEFPKPRGI
jgi:NAD(P)H-hydrate repair Nnr-like enzyme with NAD(P)H-hydrate dehydratase domain